MLMHQRIGTELVATGDLDGGKAAFDTAGHAIEQLIAADATNTSYRVDLAANHYSLGRVLLDTNTPAAIRASTAEYATAVTLFQAVVDKDPTNLDTLRKLETAVQGLGDSYEMVEDARAIEPRVSSERCHPRTSWSPRSPTHHDHLFEKLAIHFNLGELAEAIHQGDARAEYRTALELGDRLVKLEPNNTQYVGARKQVADNLAKCCKK